MTKAVVAAAVFAFSIGIANANELSSKGCHAISVPPLNAAEAINALARQTGAKLLFPYDLTQSYRARPVIGCYTIQEAMNIMLKGSGLTSGLSDNGLYLISIEESKYPDRNNSYEGKDNMIDKKKNLLAVMIGFLMGTSGTQGALAQNPEASAESDVLPIFEEIVVTGVRYMTRDSLNAKRESAKQVEFIATDENGGSYISNVADLVAKSPGVTTIESAGGTGASGSTSASSDRAAVRGIDPVKSGVTINNLLIANSNTDDRSMYLDQFPSNMASGFAVYKTFLASDYANAIGGAMDIVTRNGLDYDEPLVSVTAEIGRIEQDEGVQDIKDPYRLDALYASRLTDSVGLVLTGSYNQRDVSRPSLYTRGRIRNIDVIDPDTGETLGSVDVPREHRQMLESVPTERMGFSARVDFEIDDSTHAWVMGMYNKVDQTVYHAKSDVRLNGNNRRALPGSTDESGTIILDDFGKTGTGLVAFSEVGEFKNESDLTAFQFGFDKQLNEDVTLGIRGSYSSATKDRSRHYDLFMHEEGEITLDYDNSDPDEPLLFLAGPSASEYFDPSQYKFLYDDQWPESVEEDVFDLAAEFEFNMDADDDGWGYKTGLRYTKTDRDYNFDHIQYDATASNTVTLADIYAANSSGLPVPGTTADYFPTYGDSDARDRLITANLGSADYVLDPDPTRSFSSDYDAAEEVAALFVMGRYRWDRVEALFGLRYERTSLSANAWQDSNLEDANGDPIYSTVSASTDYQDVLPSLALIYHTDNDDIIFRTSYSETLGRPDFKDIAPSGGRINDSTIPGLNPSVSLSNPDLEPRRSTNIDFMMEWYFSADSLFSMGVFSKKIKDEIVTVKSEEILVVANDEGIVGPQPVDVSKPINASGADLIGFEINLVSYFDFLPEPFDGFGISANSTWIDGKFETGLDTRESADFLLYQASRMSNFSVLYNKAGFDFSVSWNHMSGLPTSFDANNADKDRFNDERTLVDFKLLYAVNDQLQIYLNGRNLTAEDSVERTGTGDLYQYRVLGRSFGLGATYTF